MSSTIGLDGTGRTGLDGRDWTDGRRTTLYGRVYAMYGRVYALYGRVYALYGRMYAMYDVVRRY